MKKIVFIVYDMLPYASSWGGCQRMYFLAKKLVDTGHYVKVFAINASNKYNTYGHEILPNVEHIEIPRSQDTISSTAKSFRIKDIKLLRSIYYSIDRILFNETSQGAGMITFRQCKKGEERIIQDLKKNQYDIAIVSAPPFSIFSYINVLRKVTPNTRIIMDYRDPWNSWNGGNLITTHREKRLQKIADLIVCTTDALCNDMSAKFKLPRSKYQTVANGYVGTTISGVKNDTSLYDNSKLNFVYTGTISFGPDCVAYRDSTNLLEAIRQLSAENIDNFCFTFVGIRDLSDPYIVKIKNIFGDRIRFIEVVSSAEANQYVEAADIALVMHTANDDSGRFLVSGKLYDYIHQKKFILSIGKSDSRHACIIEKYRIGINAENTVANIKDAIKQCINKKEKKLLGENYNNVDDALFSREYQISRYLDIINKI